MKPRHLRLAGLGVACVAHAAPAEAHIVSSRLGDFFTGALHPLTDPADVLIWIGLALLASRAHAGTARWAVVAVPAGLAAGLVAALAGVGVPGILTSVALVAVGALLALAWIPSAAALVAVAVAIEALRGVENAGGITPETDLALFGAGLAGAGYAAITLATAAAVSWLAPPAPGLVGWRGVAPRVAGSWIAAIGLLLGALALRG